MSKDDRDLLNRVYIAAPCTVDWDSMQGDDRQRFCGQCKLNVYNVESLSTQEAANLIRKSEGRLCMRLYRRKDGTILTDNCPVGLRKIRARMKSCAAAAIGLFVWVGLISRVRHRHSLVTLLIFGNDSATAGYTSSSKYSYTLGATAAPADLVGVPDGTRYGSPPPYPKVELAVAPHADKNGFDWMCSGVAAIVLGLALFLKRRASIALLGTGLAALFVALGVFHGM